MPTLGLMLWTQTIALAVASEGSASAVPTLAGVPVAFLLFAATLIGVAVLHHRTLEVGLTGLVAIGLFQTTLGGLDGWAHLAHEGVLLANLFGLLLGFALLADHFERSGLPEALPAYLPDDWRGGLALLGLVFALATFLDSIAAAIIGATIARAVYDGRVHLGFLAAIVGAANAGGAGSVLGNTPTTMMWIAGIAPLTIAPAFLGAAVVLLVSGIAAARQQHAHAPIQRDADTSVPFDAGRLGVVAIQLGAAVGTNVLINLYAPEHTDGFPWLGGALLIATLATAGWRRPNWTLLPEAAKGAVFLLSLVLSASMMPVAALPEPSWLTALGLGFVSAVFDNIPLTALAIHQDGYDWALLAMSVGCGGSMIWFGSSAGVAIAAIHPEARNTLAWVRAGWHVWAGFVAGFAVMVLVLGWNPHPIAGG